MSRLVAAPRRIEFVILRTDSSPRVAPHPVSRRRSYLRLRSLWLSPTRTFTVLMWRPHGRTHSRMFLAGIQGGKREAGCPPAQAWRNEDTKFGFDFYTEEIKMAISPFAGKPADPSLL